MRISMSARLLCFRVALIISLFIPFAQEGFSTQQSEGRSDMSGYARTVSGEAMPYTSPIAAARTALIARASDGKSTIVWETEPAPASPAAGPVTFIWLAGLGSNLGERQFTLAVSGKDVATFTTSSRESWEVAGAGGARLTFQTMLVDRHRTASASCASPFHRRW